MGEGVRVIQYLRKIENHFIANQKEKAKPKVGLGGFICTLKNNK